MEMTLLKASLSPARAQVIDRSAFAELYATYLPKVYNYVSYRIGDQAEAEDLTAAIFERALTRVHMYREERGAFSTWLFAIARNVISNHFRSRRRQPEMGPLDNLPLIAVRGASPEQTVIEAEQLRQAQVCMSRLPDRDQEVLALKFGADLSNQEVAQMMGLTATHVGVLLYRAVRKLRLALEQEADNE
jgi:RNA polymerase sigma-70 factor (ECF subfamily)